MFQTSFFLDLQAVPQPVPSLATLQGSAPPNAARDIHPALRTPQGRWTLQLLQLLGFIKIIKGLTNNDIYIYKYVCIYIYHIGLWSYHVGVIPVLQSCFVHIPQVSPNFGTSKCSDCRLSMGKPCCFIRHCLGKWEWDMFGNTRNSVGLMNLMIPIFAKEQLFAHMINLFLSNAHNYFSPW